MHHEKYEVRKARSEAMIEAGVKPVLDGFNEGIDQRAEWRELLIKAVQPPTLNTSVSTPEN